MAVIYMPKKPMADMLPTLLSNMILQNQARSHQKQAAEENRIARLQEEGYTEEAPEGATTPDLTVGKKKLFAPKITVGKPIPLGDTGTSLVPIMRNGKTVSFREVTGKADKFNIDEALAQKNIIKTSQGPVQLETGPDGKITARLLVPPGSSNAGVNVDMQTIYGPNGQTKRIAIQKSGDYTPPAGWSLTKPPETTAEEYAPQMEDYINTKTREVVPVNTRDPNAIKLAEQLGFTKIGPEQRGYSMQMGKSSAEREAKIVAESQTARNTVQTLTALDNLLDRFETGKLTKVQMSLQQYANALGLPVDISQLSSKEAFNAFTEQLALQSRNQGEGMVLAGQMSDRDVQFLRDMNPNLVMTKSGNKMIIRMRTVMAKRQNEVANLMREYKAKNKGIFDMTGFESYLSENFGKKSIFGIPEGSSLVGTDDKTGLPAYQTPDGKFIIPSF